MAKLSIEVTGKIRSGLFLLSALWEQGPAVAHLMREKLRPSLGEGEEPPGALKVPPESGSPLMVPPESGSLLWCHPNRCESMSPGGGSS